MPEARHKWLYDSVLGSREREVITTEDYWVQGFFGSDKNVLEIIDHAILWLKSTDLYIWKG